MKAKLFDESKFAALARRTVAEGIVLLKNDDNLLPIKKGTKVALFGRSQFNYYKSGTDIFIEDIKTFQKANKKVFIIVDMKEKVDKIKEFLHDK